MRSRFDRNPRRSRRHGAGARMAAPCRRHAISEQTFYQWKLKYGGLKQSEVTQLNALNEENTRLNQLVADQWIAMSPRQLDSLAHHLMAGRNPVLSCSLGPGQGDNR